MFVSLLPRMISDGEAAMEPSSPKPWVGSRGSRKLHICAHRFRKERGVVLPADLRRVAHQMTDFEKRDACLGELTAECVPVMETCPVEARSLVGGTKIPGKVVGIPTLAIWAWEASIVRDTSVDLD